MYIRNKQQEQVRQEKEQERLFLNRPLVMVEEQGDATILTAAIISLVSCVTVLGIAAVVLVVRRRKEQTVAHNNVYQLSASSSSSSSSSSNTSSSSSTASSSANSTYLPFSSPSPTNDYSYMLGSDGRTYRTLTPTHSLPAPLHPTEGLQPIPVLQAYLPEELYVDIDKQQNKEQQQVWGQPRYYYTQQQ